MLHVNFVISTLGNDEYMNRTQNSHKTPRRYVQLRHGGVEILIQDVSCTRKGLFQYKHKLPFTVSAYTFRESIGTNESHLTTGILYKYSKRWGTWKLKVTAWTYMKKIPHINDARKITVYTHTDMQSSSQQPLPSYQPIVIEQRDISNAEGKTCPSGGCASLLSSHASSSATGSLNKWRKSRRGDR